MVLIYDLLQPIKILVLLTLIVACINLDWKKQVHQLLITILICCCLTEMIVPILHYNEYSSGLVSTVGALVHHSLWIFLAIKILTFRKEVVVLVIAFWAFGIFNLFFMEGLVKFNYTTFVLGAFIYMALVVYGSLYELNRENLILFLSNNYLLLFVPVILFFGLSFMFAFQSRNVTSALLFRNIKLWHFVIYYVNIIYYVLVNLYIYREKRTRDAA